LYENLKFKFHDFSGSVCTTLAKINLNVITWIYHRFTSATICWRNYRQFASCTLAAYKKYCTSSIQRMLHLNSGQTKS